VDRKRMKRTHLRRGAVIFFLIFIFADILSTKVCCGEILGLPDSEAGELTACAADLAITSFTPFAVVRSSSSGLGLVATESQQGPASNCAHSRAITSLIPIRGGSGPRSSSRPKPCG
jgi:hypothetical protein